MCQSLPTPAAALAYRGIEIMYIVQIKNPNRFSWKELPVTQCRFRSLSKSITLHNDIKASAMYAGMDVRVWQTEADSRVDLDLSTDAKFAVLRAALG